MKYPCPKCGIKLDKRGGWKHEKYCDGNQPTPRQSTRKITSTSTSKITSTKQTPAPTPTPTLPLSPAECVNAAVRQLADALVKFVLAEVTFSIQSSVVGLQPSVAAPAERRPLTAESSSSSLHSLSDQQLRDRLGVAKAANNLGLCAKITNVLRMRDRSATVIANTHQEEV